MDDEVLVAFENGDVMHPFVIGGLYNGKDKPRLGDNLFDNGKVRRRGFVSRKGHRLIFFDADDASGVALVTSNGKLQVALNETNQRAARQGRHEGHRRVGPGDRPQFRRTSSIRATALVRAGKVTIKATASSISTARSSS